MSRFVLHILIHTIYLAPCCVFILILTIWHASKLIRNHTWASCYTSYWLMSVQSCSVVAPCWCYHYIYMSFVLWQSYANHRHMRILSYCNPRLTYLSGLVMFLVSWSSIWLCVYSLFHISISLCPIWCVLTHLYGCAHMALSMRKLIDNPILVEWDYRDT